MGSYAHACAMAGVPVVGWRNTTQCEYNCEGGRIWDVCAGGNCEKTCEMISNGEAEQCVAVSIRFMIQGIL